MGKNVSGCHQLTFQRSHHLADVDQDSLKFLVGHGTLAERLQFGVVSLPAGVFVGEKPEHFV